MSSERLAEQILRFMQTDSSGPHVAGELAEAMGVGEGELGTFHAACKALMKTGRVVLGSRDVVLPAPHPGKITGRFRANPRGFGFVIPDTPNAHGDLYVSPRGTGGAMTGDTVVARVVKRGKRGTKMKYEGRIVSVLKRGQNRFVGELKRQLNRWFVIPDGNVLHVPLVVGDPGAKDAKAGDQVVVEITRYPEDGKDARGVIVKTLGRRGDPGVDALAIIEHHGLPGPFDESVVAEARAVGLAFDARKESKVRENLKDLTIITIDPVDAKDFDDAISLEECARGGVELGVHIADVAHFVQAGGALDREARSRGNSVYLPGLVIPMIPEILSNGVCSLQERETRLTKSVFITFDARGQVRKTRVANTMIRSTKRLTYEQASAVLEGKRGRVGAKIVTLLERMDRLARKIQRRRQRAGMFELDLPEVDLVRDDDGRVVDVRQEDTSYSHKIIEMFMVEANEAVSRILTAADIPHLRRIHPEPRELTSSDLRRFLAALGHELPADASRLDIQELLNSVRGKEDAFAVHLAVLRSMQAAEYSPAEVGHYALTSDDYAHFTSPIRRYPDLTIHRLVDALLDESFDNAADSPGVLDQATLEELGAACTESEDRAESAERELKLVLLLRLLEKRVGNELRGIVTGIVNMGVFVQLDKYLVEGLLRFEQLSDDWWEVDRTRACVVGQRSGKRIKVGDRIDVVISRVHLPTRQLDLATAQSFAAAKGAKKSGGRGTSRSGSRAGTRGKKTVAKAAKSRGGAKKRGTGKRIKTRKKSAARSKRKR